MQVVRLGSFHPSLRLLVGLAVSLTLFGALGAASALALEGPGVEGRVSDSKGNPIEFVHVGVQPTGGKEGFVAKEFTDSEGRYSIELSEAGVYDVVFTPPPESGLEAQTFTAVEIKEATTLDVVLAGQVGAESVAFSGVVRDASGDPAPEIGVELCDETGLSRNQPTGSDGRFSFGREPGSYCWGLLVRKLDSPSLPRGFYLEGEPLELSEDRDVDLTIPSVPVTVKVLGEEGEPLSDANVYVSTDDGPGGTPVEIAPGLVMRQHNSEDGALTDAKGEAQLELFDTHAGSASGWVQAPEGSGYAGVRIPVQAIHGPTTIEVTLVKPVTFSGIVRYANGNPAEGIAVELCDETGSYRNKTTGADGRFSFERAPGQYCWDLGGGQPDSASLPSGFLLWGEPLELSEDREVDLTIPFVPVTVRVLGEAGEPLSGAGVFALAFPKGSAKTSIELAPGISMSDFSIEDRALTDAKGEAQLVLFDTDTAFGFVEAPEGSGYLNTSIPGFAIEGPTTIEVALEKEQGSDITPPSVEVTSPVKGATYQRNDLVLASYACTDEPGGSGLASCIGDVPAGSPIDTSAAGKHEFIVTATDNSGNVFMETVAYFVSVTPQEEVEDLIGVVKQLSIAPAIKESLLTKLGEVLAHLEKGKTQKACTVLGKFTQQVKKQSGKKIPSKDAASLIERAEAIRLNLKCT